MMEAASFWEKNPIGHSFAKSLYSSKQWFEEIAKEKDRLYSKRREVFPQFTGKSTLEIGVGSGIDHKLLSEYTEDLSGLDNSPECIRLTERYSGLPVALGDARKMPYDSNQFEAIYSYGVFHHIPSVELAVAETYRVLKPEGFAIIVVYHKFSFFYIKIRVMRVLRQEFLDESLSERLSRIEQGTGEVFVSVWTKKQAKELFKAFSKVEISKSSPLNWFMTIKATK